MKIGKKGEIDPKNFKKIDEMFKSIKILPNKENKKN